jgi:hypothetical protein
VSDLELRQAIVDEEHLKLLRIAYLVSASMHALFSLFGLLYVAMGVMVGTVLSTLPARNGATPPPAFVGWLFGLMGAGFFLLMILLAILKFRAARCLKARKSRGYCLVVAGISCLGIPYGTLLGVGTFLVLGRDSVKRLFEGAPEPVAET